MLLVLRHLTDMPKRRLYLFGGRSLGLIRWRRGLSPRGLVKAFGGSARYQSVTPQERIKISRGPKAREGGMLSVEVRDRKILRHWLADARRHLEQAVRERASEQAIEALRIRLVFLLERLDRLHVTDRLGK